MIQGKPVVSQTRRLHSELPEAVIVLLDAARRRRKAGHFAHSSWRVLDEEAALHEVAVSPRLFGDPARVLEALLHEAAHGALWPLKRGGVSAGGYYHQKSFRDKCRELGLECRFVHTRYGWAETLWPQDGVPRVYRRILAQLERELPAQETAPPAPPPVPGGKQLPKRGQIRLTCECPRSIYAAASVAANGGILCEECGVSFSRTL